MSRAHEAGTTERDAARKSFLQEHGWSAAAVEALPADMSFRRYFRLTDGARTALLMDSPPNKEDIRPFIKLALHLRSMDFSTPEILFLDDVQGFAIIEDFGTSTYTALIENGADHHALYGLAVDTLAALHRHPQIGNVDVPVYTVEKLINEASELVDWYYPALTGAIINPTARSQYVNAWRSVFAAMPNPNTTLTLRDFHVDNLMVLEDREGLARCGILDFQDAVIGHPAYDLVSLLEDARRDMDDGMAAAMRNRYAVQMPSMAEPDFDTWYRVLGVQRHAKVAGRFTRFCLRDHNPGMLCHIPRVMNLLARSLDTPALRPVKEWFDSHIPDPQQALSEVDMGEIRKLVCLSNMEPNG